MVYISTSTLLFFIILLSCTNKNNNTNVNKSELTIKEFYQSKMDEKNFQLENNGPCDNASDDSVHIRSFAYFDTKKYTKSTAVAEFKFLDACCQEFLGDYQIKNDTLTFYFEKVNDKFCSCQCWYRYKLTINEPREKYTEIVIKEKN